MNRFLFSSIAQVEKIQPAMLTARQTVPEIVFSDHKFRTVKAILAGLVSIIQL